MNFKATFLIIAICILALAGCDSTSNEAAKVKNLVFVLENYEDPRPYAEHFYSKFAQVSVALQVDKRVGGRTAQFLARRFYNWGAFRDSWRFILLSDVATMRPSDRELVRSLILLLGDYTPSHSDAAYFNEQKEWARDLVTNTREARLGPDDLASLCDPDSLALLSAYCVAVHTDMSHEIAGLVFEALQSAVFRKLGCNSWSDVFRNAEYLPTFHIVDCYIITRFLESTDNFDFEFPLLVESPPGGRERLSSDLFFGMLKVRNFTDDHRSYFGAIEHILTRCHLSPDRTPPPRPERASPPPPGSVSGNQ